MMLPLATDVRMRTLPYANAFLIALTVMAYLAFGPAFAREDHPLVLTRWSVGGLLGHVWMHADWWHLAGNMLFLWVFGNAVCSRIGNFWYPLLYVGLGMVTGLVAMPPDGVRAAGASAAINGIVGVFILLFPASRVKLLYTVAYVYGNVAWLPAMFLAGLWFAFDTYGLAVGAGGVGYGAHVAGLLVGLGLGAVLVHTRRVEMEPGEKSLLHLVGLMPPKESAPTFRPAPGAPAVPCAPPAEVVRSGRSQFRARHSIGAPVRVRCVCGTYATALPEMAGHAVHCRGCGRLVRFPAAPPAGLGRESRGVA